MSYREIAEHLNISIKTVETQMGIALKRLKSIVKKNWETAFITILLTLLVYSLLK